MRRPEALRPACRLAAAARARQVARVACVALGLRALAGTAAAQAPVADSVPRRCTDSRPGDEAPPTHAFRIERHLLRMPDGVALSATLFHPVATADGERFPVLLEYLPYRKDDGFYLRDYPLHAYFACRGFLSAKVDVRGTGGSEGALPGREYSNEELQDAATVIAQLAALPSGTGAVGMWGISWGAFNALRVARTPPAALRAILAVHGSDDLYRDDVRFLDAGLHLDPYALQIDSDNALPRSPGYVVDSAYLAERFDRRPWVLAYLAQPLDGPFWRAPPRDGDPAGLRVPAYLIGGLADGYRDSPIRALARATVPLKVEIGPWAHDWPDNAVAGPRHEWRARAVRWWRHWLLGEDTGLLREPRLLLYVRDSVPPGPSGHVPGAYRFLAGLDPAGPVASWHAATPGRLVARAEGATTVTVHHVPGRGAPVGIWWGDVHGDLRRDDARATTFDAPPTATPLVLAGFPRVRLRATTTMPRAHWSVRLEDVFPDGRVSLIAGRVLNWALTEDATALAARSPGAWIDTTLALHFTTWTLRPGHRLRLSVSHAQFPMTWPSPFPGTSTLALGADGVRVEVPLLPAEASPSPVVLPPPGGRDERPDARFTDYERIAPATRRDPATGVVAYTEGMRWSQEIGSGFRQHYRERHRYAVDPRRPEAATYAGRTRHALVVQGRRLVLVTRLEMTSSRDSLRVTFTRELSEDGRPVRARRWNETFPRVAH